MLEQAKDFKDESETLFALMNPLSDADFKRPTLFKGWTFNDILGHLHHGNMLADLSLNDVNDVASVVGSIVSSDANIIFGTSVDETMTGEISVTVVATNFAA